MPVELPFGLAAPSAADVDGHDDEADINDDHDDASKDRLSSDDDKTEVLPQRKGKMKMNRPSPPGSAEQQKKSKAVEVVTSEAAVPAPPPPPPPPQTSGLGIKGMSYVLNKKNVCKCVACATPILVGELRWIVRTRRKSRYDSFCHSGPTHACVAEALQGLEEEAVHTLSHMLLSGQHDDHEDQKATVSSLVECLKNSADGAEDVAVR